MKLDLIIKYIIEYVIALFDLLSRNKLSEETIINC